MFLLYPPLLHRLSLPAPIKAELRELHIPTPDKAFIRLPGTASVWQELQVYQTAALTHLAGRGLLEPTALREGGAVLSPEKLPGEVAERCLNANAAHDGLIRFLVHSLAPVATFGRDSLFTRAGLPTRGPIA